MKIRTTSSSRASFPSLVPTVLSKLAIVSIALLAMSPLAKAANSIQTVISGSTNLTSATTYNPNGVPSATTDVLFASGSTYSPAAFTVPTSGTFGSVNDLNTTALTISNAAGTAATTLKLGGASGTDSVAGSNAADLIYTGTGSSLTFTAGSGNTALGVVLGQNGNFDNLGTLSIGSLISGTGNLTVNEASNATGVATLSGTISATGNLILNNNGTVSNGIVISGNPNNAGTITNSGTGTTGIFVSSSNAALAGAVLISGSLGGSVTGVNQNSSTSDLILGGNNATYTGGININAGRLDIANYASGFSNALGAATDVVTLGSTGSNATLNFGADLSGSHNNNATIAGLIHVSGTGVNAITATDYSPTFSGAVTLEGNGTTQPTNLTVAPINTGGSSITFTGGVTGTGNIIVSVASSSAGNFVSFTTGTVNNTGSITFNNASVNGGTTGGGGGINTISANIGSNVTGITQNSLTNQVTLSGTNSNSGPITVQAGTLEVAKEASLYNNNSVGAGWTASNIIVQPGATLAFGGIGTAGGFTASDIQTLSGLGTATGGFENGSYIGIDTSAASATLSSVIANPNGGANVIGLNKLGANTLTITGTDTYTGPTTIYGGSLQFGNGTTNGSVSNSASILINSGNLVFDPAAGTVESSNGSIGGAGGVTVSGNPTGTVALGGTNIYTGATTITSGTLDLTNSLALQNSALGAPSAGAGVTFDSSVASNTFFVDTLSGNPNLLLNNTAGAGINLTIGSFRNDSTTTTGTLSGLGGITAFGFSNTITLEGSNTYTGTTTVTGATLNLGGGTANGSINGGPLVIGGFAGGGVLAYTRTGTVAQSFSGTTITRGQDSITTSTATQTLNLGVITTGTGGIVDINPFSGSSITTTSSNTNGIVGGFATYGGKATWAVSNGGSSSITGLALGAYTSSTATTIAPGATANVDFVASNTTNWTTQTINSLRFNQSTAQTLTMGANQVLTIATGGILDTPTASSGGTISGGILLGSPGGQLSVSTNTGTVTINSLIVDNGSPTAVADSESSANRYLTINNTNNSFSGGFYFNGGGVNAGAQGTALGVGDVFFGNSNIYTGVAGGGIVFGTFNNVMFSGLLASENGANSSNGDISGNSGGVWNLLGVPGDVQTYSGIIGNYSGGRVVNLALDSGTQIIGNTDIGSNKVIVDGGTFQVGTGYSGSFSNANNNVALLLGGGTYVQYGNLAGTSSQTYSGGITVLPGGSTVTAANNSGAGVLLVGNGITRNVGGTVNFVLPVGPQSSINGVTTTNLNTNGILGGYATVGGNDWAANATNASGGNIVGFSTVGSYASDTWTSGSNTTVTLATNTAYNNVTTNSLRFNSGTADTVTLSGSNIIQSGGILVTPSATNGGVITGGTLTGATSADLIVIQNSTGGGLTINSIISNDVGATALTKSGPGLLTLTGANTYTGGLFLNGGILNAATANINGSSTTNGIEFNGGTLQAAAGGITTNKTITIGATGATIDTNGYSVTLGGVIGGIASSTNGGSMPGGAGAIGGFVATGDFAFTKTGSGTLTLSGTNTFEGSLVINNGTVLDANASASTIGTGYVIFNNNGNTPTLDLGGKSPTVAGLIGAGTNGVVTNSGTAASTLTFDGAFGETFAGTIQNGSKAIALTENLQNPTEAVVLSNSNTYTGATTVTQGILSAGVASVSGVSGAFGLNSAVIMSSTSSATLNIAGYNTQIGSLTGGSATQGNVTLGAATLTLGGDNTSPAAYAGVISSTGSPTTSIVKIGTGTQTFSGANTYTGATTINSGTLSAGVASVAGVSGAFGLNSAIVMSSTSSATMNISGYNTQIGSLTGGSGSFGNVTLGAATLTLGGDNTSPAAYAGVISSTGSPTTSIVKIGTGTETFTGASTYTGATNINSGTLSVNNVATGATAQALGEGNTINLGVAATSSGVLQYTGGAATLDKNINALGNGGDTINNSGSGTLILSGNLVKNGTVLNLNNATSGINVTGVISGTSSGSDLFVTGTGGATTLSNHNTYNGPTVVYGGGTLVNGTNDALPDTVTGASNTTLTLGNGETSGTNTYDLAGFSQTIGNLMTLSGGTTVNQVISSNGAGGASAATGSLTVNVASGSDTYNGFLGGSGSGTNFGLVKAGSGTLVLGQASTYTGPTVVNGGTLKGNVTNSLGATSSVTVNGGGTLLLGASQAINASAPTTLNGGTFNANSLYSQGSSTSGTPSAGLGALTLSANSTIDFGAGTGGGAGNTNVIAFAASGSATWAPGVLLTIQDWNGIVGSPDGTNAGVSQDALYIGADNSTASLSAAQLAEIQFAIGSTDYAAGQASNGEIYATTTVVPEPSTVFAALALFGFVGYRERRRLSGLASALFGI